MKFILKIVRGKQYYTSEFRGHKVVIFQAEDDKWHYLIYDDTGIVYNSMNHSAGFKYWKYAHSLCYKWFRKNLKNLKKPLRKKDKVQIIK